MVLRRATRTYRTNTQRRCHFHYRGLECKSGKSRNTWTNRQIWRWSTEWSRTKVNRVLPKECTGHSKHPFQQHKRRLMAHGTLTSPDGQYWNQSDDIFRSQRWRSSIQSAKDKIRSWLWHRPWTPEMVGWHHWQWTWVWVNSGRWWWTGRPGVP